MSKIRVRLSRKMTWAEREALNYAFTEFQHMSYHPAEPDHILLEDSRVESRALYQEVADELERYVNVYPVAVKTFYEHEPLDEVSEFWKKMGEKV